MNPKHNNEIEQSTHNSEKYAEMVISKKTNCTHPIRYYCGNGDGMFEDSNGEYISYEEHLSIIKSLDPDWIPVSERLPSEGAPLMIWVNVYNPIKPDSWDLHHTEASAVKNSIGAKTHCYIHESVLGYDR